MSATGLRVLFAISEAFPHAKVGGLGDVGGALPAALARRGHDVRLLLPAYPWLRGGTADRTYRVRVGHRQEDVGVWRCAEDRGVAVEALGNHRYFRTEHAYGYEDEDIRPFVFFSKAVAEYSNGTAWRPDVIHCNDWHVALTPEMVARHPVNGRVTPATVLTIHNGAYQGRASPPNRHLLGGPESGTSMLCRGIAWADAVNTVSRTYLEELLTPERGMGLDAVLKSRVLPPLGILNGVDYEEFNPGTDPYLPTRYDLGDMAGKGENKAALQRRSGLPVDPDAVVIGMVTRLVDQKGVDLVLGSLQGISELRAQVVVMGVGEEVHRAGIEAAARGSDRVAYHPTNDEGLARLVYAGSDLFLAPSRFEPCGLGPLIAMRYGAVPVVRRTGGLAETIIDYRRDPDHGVGFTFVRKYSGTLTRRIAEAATVYRDTTAWAALRERGMARRFSWADAAAAYDQLYLDAVEQRRERPSPAVVR